MLDTNVHSFLKVSTVDDFVADDTDCSGGDVVDNTGFAVVEFVWLPSISEGILHKLKQVDWVGTHHTLLLRGVGFNVDDVSDSVVDQVSSHRRGTMFCRVNVPDSARETAPNPTKYTIQTNTSSNHPVVRQKLSRDNSEVLMCADVHRGDGWYFDRGESILSARSFSLLS